MHHGIIFFGNSFYSLPVLKKILDSNLPVRYVITSPDKPQGRHLRLTPNPVKQFAQNQNLAVIESLSELTSRFAEVTSGVIPLGLVAAYGRIIKPDLLNNFSHQIYNIHPSLLPKYRGPSPLQFQILDQVPITGVTLIRMDEQVDHGPVIAQQNDEILSTDTATTLGERLFSQGADMFTDFFNHQSDYTPTPQDDSQATFTRLLTKQDGFIPYADFQSQLTSPNSSLHTRFRAFSPWPGVWTINPEGKRIKLLSIHPQPKTRIEGDS